MDLGNPASYLVLAGGTPVVTSDGHEIGSVEHVLADAGEDVFDAGPDDTVPDDLKDKLRRAWDYLSGNY
jgi:hypothetical protein